MALIGRPLKRREDWRFVPSIDPASLLTDIHASAEYRAHLIPVLAQKAVAECA